MVQIQFNTGEAMVQIFAGGIQSQVLHGGQCGNHGRGFHQEKLLHVLTISHACKTPGYFLLELSHSNLLKPSESAGG